MREPWEMYTASRMQIMVRICKKNNYSATKIFSRFLNILILGLSLGVESPRGGAMFTVYALMP